MSTWAEQLKEVILAAPKDVDNAAVKKAVVDILKERCVSEHQRFIKLWCEAYEPAFGFKYAFKPKDAKKVQALLAINYGPKVDDPVAHLMRIAHESWKHRTQYPFSMATSLDTFEKRINEIRDGLNALRTGAIQPKKPASEGNMPEFKRLEMLLKLQAKHPCNPRSTAYDPAACTQAQLDGYKDIKKKIGELERNRERQVMG